MREEEEEETVGSCLQHQDLFPNEKEKRRQGGKIFSAEKGKEESGKLFLGRLLRDELKGSSTSESRAKKTEES